MFFLTSNFSLYELYENLLDLEEQYLMDTVGMYIPREHSVHSINVYLLGIYLFFNMRLFHKQLSVFFNRSNCVKSTLHNESHRSFSCFLDSWKLFSINHDIGYPLEQLVDKNGKEKNENGEEFVYKINSISEFIFTDYAMNELVFFVAVYILSKNSKELYAFDFNPKNTLYVKLDNIYSFETLKYFLNVIDLKYLCFMLKEHEQENIYTFDLRLKKFISKGTDKQIAIEELKKLKNIYVEFFYPKNKCKDWLKNSLEDFNQYIKDVEIISEKIFNEASIEYAGIFDHNSYMDFLFIIYNKLKKEITKKDFKCIEPYSEKMFDVFSEYCLLDFKDMFNSITKELAESESIQEKLLKFLQKFVNKINDKYIHQLVNEYLTTTNISERGICHLFNHIKANLDSVFCDIDSSVFYNIRDIADNDYKREVINKFSELAIRGGLISKGKDIYKLFSYHGDFSVYDHGVVSAVISLNIFLIASKLNKEIDNKKLTYNNLKLGAVKNFDDFVMENSCYAIFIHNIYASYFNKVCDKLDIKHDIIKNPFVYFALFCDNMQIWDRSYRINQGKVELEKETISNEDISIEVINDKIHIYCVTSEAENVFEKYRNKLDEYLKNGSKLISLGIIDK